MAGAAYMGSPQFDRLSKVVAGRVCNIYTEDDSAVKLFEYVTKK